MPAPMASLLNLQSVGAAQRASLWARSAEGFFPGLSVRKLDNSPQVGRIGSMPFGPGRIWSVLSPPLVVNYDPLLTHDRHLFSVMIQLTGTTEARQQRRSCLLRAGDCCAIDNGAPFELEVPSSSSYIVFVQMPRLSVLARHPYLERQTAERFDPHDAGTGLLRGLLMNVLDSAPVLDDYQRSSALAAIIELMGVAMPPKSEQAEAANWRVRAALKCIGERFADATLTAEQVAKAQGISRRRLDKLMVDAACDTLSARIWSRRLAQAAADLADPRCAVRSVSQIAFAAGFTDAAHFSRAFRQAFQCTPRQWRERRTVLPNPPRAVVGH
ncbi:MAG TPA: helix-turn-helix domain-containing protein [Steroidobacteraceae bacterium]|nr:helix-turn-helix domain-containing protein [Steroidobacteraceae bacterium]